MTEDEILRYGVRVKHGATQTMYGINLENELAKIYMDDGRLHRATIDMPEEELMVWGTKFREIAVAGLADKEAEMKAAGEI